MKPFARMILAPSLAREERGECCQCGNVANGQFQLPMSFSRKERKGRKERKTKVKLRNPHWLKSLAIHALTLIVATFIGLVIIGNGEAPGLIGTSLWVALISPLVYPLVGPYMVAFLLVTHIAVLSFLFWGVVIMSYAAYFMLLLGAILEKDRAVRVGLCIVLAVWFILTLFGLSEWAMYWSV